jgi:DNA-binding LytR/AlgR family response regulator/signal transduction histidine kinase
MENTLRYLIVEDDEFDRMSLEAEAMKFPFLEKMGACTHPLQAAEFLSQHEPDVLFLDIEMPGMTGIEFLRHLRGQKYLAVFITSHPEFAVDGFELEAFDYLIKPLTAERFAQCALRMRDFTQLRHQAAAFEKEQNSDVIIIKQGHDKVKLPLHDIRYLEAMKDYTRIVTKDKQYLVLTTLSDILEKLPATTFARVHRSYAVHREKVTAVRGNKVEVGGAGAAGTVELPVGKLYRHVLKGMLTVLLMLAGIWGMGQNKKVQVDSLLRICDSLRPNGSTAHAKLREVGLEGLRIIGPDDFEHQARFAFSTAVGYYYETRFDSAQYYFYKSLDNAQKGHLTRQIETACITLIPVNFQLQQIAKTDSVKNILQSIVDTSHDRPTLEDGYYSLGQYYQLKSYYSTAQDYFIRSIELREKEVDTTGDMKPKFDFAIQCDMLSKLYLVTQMTDKSIDALRKGQRFASVSPLVGNRLASSFVEAFMQSGKIDSALYYDRQLEANATNPIPYSSELVSSDLDLAFFYLDHGKADDAKPYIDKADTIAARVKSPILDFQVQFGKARYLIARKQYAAAVAQLNLSIPVAEQVAKDQYATDLKYMAQAQEGKGDLAAALRYYREYVDVSDSLNKDKLSRTFADLETHYRTHEKELQIASLDQENRLHLLELSNARQTRLILVLGLVALGVISLLLYFFYRNTARLNRALAMANDTKARLFGIIGHDLRAPIGKIVRMLQLQKERPELFTEDARKVHEENLKKASTTVLETMEDLLIWSKSQMQHFHPEYGKVVMREVVEKEIAFLNDQLEERGVEVVDEVPAGLLRESDENFLSVIVRNLLQNAVRHCEGDMRVVVTGGISEITITNPTTVGDARVLNERIKQGRIDSGSSGLGLQLASDLAERIGARLFFRGEKGVSLTSVLSWDKGTG